MKRFSISIKILCLSALTIIGWSCTKSDLLQGYGSQTNNAISQARMYYESTAVPLTKTIGEQQIPIKPLPGEMTPLWDRALATIFENGITLVDVPIEGTIIYTAVRHGFHHHDGEACDHDHSAVQAVQKLTVQTLADGSQQSLVATIVPEAGCTAELRDFSSATGLAGFDGFVSWHDLTGNLIRVAQYENGIQTRSVEPTGDNEAEILEIVDGAILYPAKVHPLVPITRGMVLCAICKNNKCGAPNELAQHCNICSQYDPTEFGKESLCTCRPRCPWCGTKIPAGQTSCPNNCEFPITAPVFCSVCGAIDCPGHDPSDPKPTPPVIVQRDMLAAALGTWVTHGQLQRMLDGSYGMDQEYQNYGDEYIHGLYIPGYNNGRSTAFENMKNDFIRNVRGYLFLTSEAEMSERFYYLGMALHPIADHYVLSQTRVDMLNFYSYSTPQNILTGQYIVPYMASAKPGIEAVRYIFNAVQNLSRSAAESEIEAIFDHWIDMAGTERP